MRRKDTMVSYWTHQDSAKARAEGWDLWQTDDGLRIEKFDESETFDDDAKAWKHVWAKAQKGSTLHSKVLGIILAKNQEEYNKIKQHCKGK
jgi:hypothetical protein